jgi:uncharacterized protein
MPPLAPHQIAIAGFELLLLLAGTWWIARTLAVPTVRHELLGQRRLPSWSLGGYEVALLLVTLFLCGIAGQGLAVHFFGPAVRASSDRAALEVVLYGVGFHGGALMGWPLFWALRRALLRDYGVPGGNDGHPMPLDLAGSLKRGAGALVLALPLITLASLGWTMLLRVLELPDAPQDLIAIFGAVESPWVLVAMLVVACLLAPINEELIFRGTIFRFGRQRFGRGIAIVLSSLLFGALHGNWAGFIPLAVLGAGLALAYENTGDVRVPIVAHALFNLNTILIILADLPRT